MNPGTAVLRRTFKIFFAVLLALPVAALAQPTLNSFSFTPTSINTAAGAATVTVNFTASDASPIVYFEMAFADPGGIFFQRGSKSLAPSTNVTDSVPVVFPQFSNAGTWQVVSVFMEDSAGNTTFLDTNGIGGLGFPTNLQVTSSADSIPPNLTAFSLSPASVNTTAASATIAANFTVTDDLAGANFFQVVVTSPSGNSSQTASTRFAPALSQTGSATLAFPKFSEAGTWTVTSVFVSDAAGNTLLLGTPDLVSRGFGTTFTVTSTVDSTSPTLTAFSFAPTTISTNGSPVAVNFTVTDDLSGATSFSVVFLSPSGAQFQSGSASFAPTTSLSGSTTVNFPSGLEQGTWTVSQVFISDAAGNTTILNSGNLSFPGALTVNPPGADTTPPVIIPTVTPMPNGAGWNNTLPVNVTWLVTDPESGILSSSGCGTTTFTAPTTGTTVTCTATNNASLSSSASVLVMIDIAPPVTTNALATPDPVIINTPVTISATVIDTGGSHVSSAEFQVDGGPFDDLGGSFGTDSVNVSLALPATFPILTTPGVHNICVRGHDLADNIGATQCVLFAVYDPNGGFTTGGGGSNSPAGADAANPSGSGPATFAFNPKYLPNNSTVPQGNLEFHYDAGHIVFKASTWDFLVVTNGNRGQAQGTGTLNGTSTCKFSLDAWNASFQPNNVDAFGLTIFNCDGGTATRYNLPTGPITKGSIKVHQ